MKFSHIPLLKTLCLATVVGMHCLYFYAPPFLTWKLSAREPLPVVDGITTAAVYCMIPALVFASGLLFALSWNSGRRTAGQWLLARAPLAKNRLTAWTGRTFA